MICLTVDEGYAYDFLSIAAVKANRVPSHQNSVNLSRTAQDLISQLGEAKHDEIIASPEYSRLQRVNDELFTLVDLAKTDAVKASDVDREVYNRWLAKKALQERFFPNARFSEQKIGYGAAAEIAAERPTNL